LELLLEPFLINWNLAHLQRTHFYLSTRYSRSLIYPELCLCQAPSFVLCSSLLPISWSLPPAFCPPVSLSACYPCTRFGPIFWLEIHVDIASIICKVTLMPRKIQQSLFDQIPKRGRPSSKPHGHFGGRYLKNYNPKSERPMDSKKALHLVLKSSQAVGEKSFKSEKFEAKIWKIISKHAENKGIKLYEYANGGNHLHLLLRAKHRDDYIAFIKAITGLIARTVGKSERGKPLKKKFWDARPFSRIVGFAKQEFNSIKTYLLRNTLEAIGWMKYISRESRLPSELRQMLISGVTSSA